MDRLPELIEHEQHIRTLVRVWQSAVHADREQIRREIGGELAEIQMLIERQLAEAEPSQRRVERYFLDHQLSTFTYLKPWSELFFEDVAVRDVADYRN